MIKKPTVSVLSALSLLLSAVIPTAYAIEISPLMTQSIQAPFNQTAVMMTVRYAPGEESEPHRHNAHTLVYVLEGTVEMQVKDSELVSVEAGETFYESPDDVHLISRNASQTDEAVFLVVFIKSEGAKTLTPLHE